MVLVNDIWAEVKKIVGNSDDTFTLRRLTDAVELLANKGDFDPLVGSVDICTAGEFVALPREVETVLSLNMCGRPAVARDQVFHFHLNGAGDCGPSIHWEWTDLGDACIMRELVCPVKLIAFCQEAEDENCEFWVHGLDDARNKVRTKVGEEFVNGYKVPVLKNYQALPADAPVFSQIQGIRIGDHVGPIRLSTIEGSDQTGVLLGLYQSDDTVPAYRKIKLSRCVPWVRIMFRRRTFKITSRYDLIPLHNSQAVIMMLRALKKYDEPGGIAEAEAMEATAVRWLTEEQYTRTPPVVQPIQVHDGAPLADPNDHME